ncbi:MAG: glucose-6-phosphate isomerase [Candidatus Kapaibacterium sp.]
MFESEKQKIWDSLSTVAERFKIYNLRQAFEDDTARFEKYSLKWETLLVDYSKNLIDEEVFRLLMDLARTSGLQASVESMFNGDKINFTENRAVLHTALRADGSSNVVVDGDNIMPEIIETRKRMLKFADAVRNKEFKGYTGKTISDVVNIGIGGSHLGPDMVVTALEKYQGDVKIHFVSNIDPIDITNKLKKLNPESTLFLIASKTFTTQETMTNADFAKKWFLSHGNAEYSDVSKHFVALSTNIESCREFGIVEERIFGFWDWVGGRYSLWSSIGLSIAISVGSDNFMKMLEGARKMDMHFRNTPFHQNIPVILALLGVWYADFLNAATFAIIPYEQNLIKFPEFLQQLDMESNGKKVRKNGEKVNYKTGPVVWGTIGTNSQHSFFQLIHQGTHLIPADFIASVHNHSGNSEQHKILLSNFFAQTEALMKGKTEQEVKLELRNSGINEDDINKIYAHKIFEGSKPTNSIMFNSLTPETLGMLIAMYEHKVFVQGVIWELNSFDQWGVELGKQLAKGILNELRQAEPVNSRDSSSNGLINYFLQEASE